MDTQKDLSFEFDIQKLTLQADVPLPLLLGCRGLWLPGLLLLASRELGDNSFELHWQAAAAAGDVITALAGRLCRVLSVSMRHGDDGSVPLTPHALYTAAQVCAAAAGGKGF